MEVGQVVPCCHNFPGINAIHGGLVKHRQRGCSKTSLLHTLPSHVGYVVLIQATLVNSTEVLLPRALAVLHTIVVHVPAVSSSLALCHLCDLLGHLRACALLLLGILLTLQVWHAYTQSLLTSTLGLGSRGYDRGSLALLRYVERPR